MDSLASSVAAMKQALKEKKRFCKVTKSKFVIKLLNTLSQLGYIRGFTILSEFIMVRLAYRKNRPLIRGLSLYSKPSHKIYQKVKTLKRRKIVFRTVSFTLLSSSFGSTVFTDQECLLLKRGGKPIIKLV